MKSIEKPRSAEQKQEKRTQNTENGQVFRFPFSPEFLFKTDDTWYAKCDQRDGGQRRSLAVCSRGGGAPAVIPVPCRLGGECWGAMHNLPSGQVFSPCEHAQVCVLPNWPLWCRGRCNPMRRLPRRQVSPGDHALHLVPSLPARSVDGIRGANLGLGLPRAAVP